MLQKPLIFEVLKHWFKHQLDNQRMHYISIRGLKSGSHIVVRDASTDEILDIGSISHDSTEYRATVKMKNFTPLYNVTIVKAGYKSLCITESSPNLLVCQQTDHYFIKQ
jgi:hypothetical protein